MSNDELEQLIYRLENTIGILLAYLKGSNLLTQSEYNDLQSASMRDITWGDVSAARDLMDSAPVPDRGEGEIYRGPDT